MGTEPFVVEGEKDLDGLVKRLKNHITWIVCKEIKVVKANNCVKLFNGKELVAEVLPVSTSYAIHSPKAKDFMIEEFISLYPPKRYR